MEQVLCAENPSKTNFDYSNPEAMVAALGTSPLSWSLCDHELLSVIYICGLSYKDVEIVSVSLTEHLLLAKTLAKTAFLRCFLLV